ncbi:MAG: GNAT family N-acetyltransferase [Eubacteriaceae bacterium]|nr:GNAT family N-acetyltransferase [Eubacteriaceae bacterium]
MLESDRLILRDWEQKDIDDIVEGLNNIDVSKWLASIPHPYTKEMAIQWVGYCMENTNDGDNRKSYEFAIVLKSENKVIGGTSIDRIDKFHGTSGGGGIWLNTKYHSKGYGSEAFGKRIEFAFENLGLRRLENGFFTGNNASFKMQEKFGYKIEGVKRKRYKCMADGQLKDECITGLLKEEWKK